MSRPRYEKSEGWTLSPYEDLSNAFVFMREPPGVLILDKASWLALEMATAYSLETAADRYTKIAGQPRAAFDKHVSDLLLQGLLRVIA
ncbi:hypothetical protein AB0K16_29390 [Nonomuraea jabiensis]|uniref:Uncharacterized protein n=1 Tax=Nonomuraea jabiensis TaxID=882448 RepID=A0A7W9L7K0_9ACTN|nr:hypothetical protein [Nonomuraea jabiensis]MBB5773561.1 hypothetical protein [Nonomuraea jabiensis]